MLMKIDLYIWVFILQVSYRSDLVGNRLMLQVMPLIVC